MVSIITTIEFELEHEPDQLRTPVVAELPETADDNLRERLSTRYGARWSDDRMQFEFDVRYTLSVSTSLKRADIAEIQFQPKHPQLPLDAIVEQATSTAMARADWPVSVVEIMEEQVDHRFGEDYATLVFRGRFVARVTQTKP